VEGMSKMAAPHVSSVAGDRRSEVQVIQRAREGDRTAFEDLYRLHSRRVYAVCLRMVTDPTEPEDLTQEAFLLLFRKIHTFRGESDFPTWLQRLAVDIHIHVVNAAFNLWHANRLHQSQGSRTLGVCKHG